MSPAITHDRGVRYKTLDASIQEVSGRHIEFIASQEIQDRDGDVIECAGIDTRDFMRNPILLGDHDKNFLLGKITRLWKERLPEGPALLAKAELLPAGVSARADERYQAIKFGAAKGISIGFLVRAHEPTPTGYRFKAVDLMEVSQVSIPSCPTCLITSKSKALQSKKEESMYLTNNTLEHTVARQLAALFEDQIIDKEPADDPFDAMLAQMREMSSDQFMLLMLRQLATLGEHATIADLLHAITQQGVSAVRSWAPEVWDIDEAALAATIAKVIGDEAGKQTRAALNAALGRLD